jgi:hypothetical protein
MPKITTSKGKTYNIDYVYLNDVNHTLRISMHTEKRFPELSEDFDGCDTLTYENGEAVRIVYEGYTALTFLSRFNDTVSLTFEKEDDNGTV